MALTPHLQLLTSPLEEAGDFTEPEVGGAKVRGQSRPYLEGIWYRWAEYHQKQFRRRLTQQRMGTFDLNILNGKVLQEGSNTQEFHEFLRTLEMTGTRPQAAKVSAAAPTFVWMTRIGNGCVILLVCWLGCQLWYTGARVLETRGSSISMGTFCRVLCCGMAALLVKPNYEPVEEVSEEKEEPQDQELNLINLGAAWKSESPDVCRAVGLLGAECPAEPPGN